MKIAHSGAEVESAIAEHGDDIDAEMLEMLERRLERARDDTAERGSVEGLTALLQRQGLQGVWAPNLIALPCIQLTMRLVYAIA